MRIQISLRQRWYSPAAHALDLVSRLFGKWAVVRSHRVRRADGPVPGNLLTGEAWMTDDTVH